MKNLYLILFVLCSNILQAKKAEIPFEIIVAESDKIVLGKIISATDSSYIVEIENDLINSKNKSSRITIKKWTEWQCDFHKIEYKTNTSVLLFLKKSFEGKTYEPLHGSSGELQIERDSVIIENYGKVELQMAINSITYLRNCYTYIGDYWNDGKENTYLEANCSSKESDQFWKQNDFNSWIWQSATKRKTFEKKLLYELNYKDPVNVVNSLHFIVKKQDTELMQVICDPQLYYNDNVEQLIDFNINDPLTVNLLTKLEKDYSVEEVRKSENQYICNLKYNGKTLFWIVLVKRYSNWYVSQIREP